MTKPLLLAAAACLAVSACAARPEPVRTVFLSGPGAQSHLAHGYGPGRNVTVIERRDGRGPLIVNGRYFDTGRPLPPDFERRMAEVRQRADEARQRGEEARRGGDEARRRGEEARQRGEEARARGEEARRYAERLRGQCERGEIKCTVIDNGVVIIR